MTSAAAHRMPHTNFHTTKHSQTQPIRSTKVSFSFLPSKPLQSQIFKHIQPHSFRPTNSSKKPIRPLFFSPESILLFVYFFIFLCLRLLFTLLPPDFPQRWHRLLVFSEEADSRSCNYPSHLWKAVVAYEDRRFFRHCGIDPVGITRALLLFPDGGGGSTITQQLVKNTLLNGERTFSRKAIEMVLALILERKMSKRKIISSYLGKIYWGHGIYGIESASDFYFGKHPSLLSLGESAVLAGIIPAPELRSPFRDPSRGKTSQARVLRRMVDVGFLDIQTALSIVNQPLHLRAGGLERPNRLLYSLYFSVEELGDSHKQGGWNSILKDIWDWERESNIWEVREDMERWAQRVQKSSAAVNSFIKFDLNIVFLRTGWHNICLLSVMTCLEFLFSLSFCLCAMPFIQIVKRVIKFLVLTICKSYPLALPILKTLADLVAGVMQIAVALPSRRSIYHVDSEWGTI